MAESAGQPLPYPRLKELGPDTGEKFLYEYYLAQIEREAEDFKSWKKIVQNHQRGARAKHASNGVEAARASLARRGGTPPKARRPWVSRCFSLVIARSFLHSSLT